ncbi:MAG TPA: PH domain-containing protein [Streptosporangiaceae bacterium]
MIAEPGSEPGDGAGAEPAWRWLSPRSLIVRPVTDLLRALPVIAGLLIFGSRHGPNLWGLGFAAFAIVTSIVRYCTTRYRITGERVYLRHGLLSQKVLSVPRDRIRSVDLSAHVVYRLLGLRKVQVGTGRNDRRQGGSLHLDALRLADAEALRAALLASPLPPPPAAAQVTGTRVTGTRPAPAVAAGPAERELARLAPGWVRYAPFTLTGLVIIGVVVGFAFQVIDATHVDITAIGPVHRLTVTLSHLTILQRALEVAAAILIILVLLSVAGYVALFWNFRLVAIGTGMLRVSRGLLSTRTTTIDTRRLRGAELSEPLLLRAVGGARCLAITTGLRVGHGAERGGSLLLPPAPRQVAGTVASAVLETAVLEAAVLEAAVPETAVLEAAVLEAAVPEAAVLGAAVLEKAGEPAVPASAASGPTACPPLNPEQVLPDPAVSQPLAPDQAAPDPAASQPLAPEPTAGPAAGWRPAGVPAPGWAAELLTGELIRHGPAARRRRYTRAVGVAGVLAAAGVVAWAVGPFPAWAGLGSLIFLPLGAALAADRYASLGHRLSGGWLVTRTGSLIRRRSVLSVEGIIGWRIHQSWFQRRQGLASLAATTAAGRQHYVAHDLPVAAALDLATAATTGLVGPFRTPA